MSLQPSDKAWIALGVGVLGWNLTCEDGETLSEAADRWPMWLALPAAFAVAAHVSNAVPTNLDPIHWLFVLSRKWRRP